MFIDTLNESGRKANRAPIGHGENSSSRSTTGGATHDIGLWLILTKFMDFIDDSRVGSF